MSKSDPQLGAKVFEYLNREGVETPMLGLPFDHTDSYKIEVISEKFKEIMNILNLDLKDDSLQETPVRVAKMFVNEIFWGLNYDNFPKCTTVENKIKYDEMVLVRGAKVASHCEHHFVAITGVANIAYIPENKVIGLSKINRIVEFFSKRPQIQERLTSQIFHALEFVLETSNIAVVIEAEHNCVKSRGIQDINSDTVTSKLGGVFMKHEVKTEFLQLIKKN